MASKLNTAVFMGLSLIALSCTRGTEARTDAPKPIVAHTETIQPVKIADVFQVPGTVRAKTSTILASRIPGQVLSVAVHEGDRVRRNQMLVEIDDRDASAQLRRAQAAADEARRAEDEADRSIKAADAAARAAESGRELAASTKKRYDLLRERHSISPQEYDEVEHRLKAAVLEVERSQESLSASKARRDQMRARIEQADAESDTARTVLGYSRIAAPIDGIVTARHIEPGMLAAPGVLLLTIDDDRTYQLEAIVEESRTANVRIGQIARVEIEALGATLNARVAEIVPAADPATRTYTAKLDLLWPAGSNPNVRSGFFGRAVFRDGERETLVIPESALVHRGQLEGVYIVENGTCVLRLVKTGKHYTQGIEILSGLDAGTRIITAPTADISEGVKIVEESHRKNP